MLPVVALLLVVVVFLASALLAVVAAWIAVIAIVIAVAMDPNQCLKETSSRAHYPEVECRKHRLGSLSKQTLKP